ncbi:MAG: molecular chaperone DnaK [Cellvibrionaceae bacterium]|nr:molecular chaperone DnaK [Cellvibrionaceae bacterium]|tara:strand:- start:6266 stop:6697 length:432 start_codon:yes stop_codon:yes gene_type:complete
MSTSQSDGCTLSEEQLLKAPESDYMNEEQLEFFRRHLIELHHSVSERLRHAKKEITKSPDSGDESDHASWEAECTLLLRIIDREQKLLPKIQQALKRISSGCYGYCMESGEPIGIQRLLIRPTAEYCADVKTLQEIKENFYRD